MVTFVVAIESDQEAFNAVLELVNNVGTKERGTKRGNVVGLGSYDRAVCLGRHILPLVHLFIVLLKICFVTLLSCSGSCRGV